MVWRKKYFYLSTLSFLIFFSIPITQFEAQSQVIYTPPKDPGTPNKSPGGIRRYKNPPNSDVRYIPPKGIGTPQNASGGIVRGDRTPYIHPNGVGIPNSEGRIRRSGKCADATCLIALMPGTSNNKLDHYPLTVLERPTFYFNLPKIEGRAYFNLYKEGQNSVPRTSVYSTAFDIAAESGVIGFDLPENAPALAVNKGYYWEFEIISSANTKEIVSGYVKRVTLSADLDKQLKTVSPLEHASLYAKSGIWLDTIKTLAKLRLTQPRNQQLIQEWQELLKSVELVKIAEQPLVEWYTKKK